MGSTSGVGRSINGAGGYSYIRVHRPSDVHEYMNMSPLLLSIFLRTPLASTLAVVKIKKRWV